LPSKYVIGIHKTNAEKKRREVLVQDGAIRERKKANRKIQDIDRLRDRYY